MPESPTFRQRRLARGRRPGVARPRRSMMIPLSFCSCTHWAVYLGAQLVRSPVTVRPSEVRPERVRTPGVLQDRHQLVDGIRGMAAADRQIPIRLQAGVRAAAVSKS